MTTHAIVTPFISIFIPHHPCANENKRVRNERLQDFKFKTVQQYESLLSRTKRLLIKRYCTPVNILETTWKLNCKTVEPICTNTLKLGINIKYLIISDNSLI